MGLLASIFTWWNGATLGTSLFTRRHGREVGRDAAGNVDLTPATRDRFLTARALGFSMGGYGALRFSRALRLNQVVGTFRVAMA